MTAMLEADVAFRSMQQADLERVMQIEKSICEIPWTRRNFEDCLDSDYHCQLLCYEGMHVGHSVLSAAAGEAHLLNISIDFSAQGKGLGRVLLRHMLAAAKELGAQTVFLEVRESNQVAQGLYLSEEFNELGRRPNYYPAKQGREDAVIMAMEL